MDSSEGDVAFESRKIWREKLALRRAPKALSFFLPRHCTSVDAHLSRSCAHRVENEEKKEQEGKATRGGGTVVDGRPAPLCINRALIIRRH